MTPDLPTEARAPIAPSASLWERICRPRGSLSSILALVGGNSVSSLLGAIGGLLVARFVDPATAGAFRTYTIPLMYLTFLHLGTFDGLYRQIPFYRGQGRLNEVETIASSAGAWNVLLSGAFSAGFLLLAGWCLVRGDAQGAFGWSAQALVTWSVFYGGFLGTTYRTLDRFIAATRVQMIQAVLSLLAVFTLPILGFVGLCLRSALPSVIGTWLLHGARPLRAPPRFRRESFVDVVRIGMPFCFWGSLYSSVWGAIENTLMLSLAGVNGLGLFAVAVMLREGICIVPQAIHQVLTPRVIHAYGREGRLDEAHTILYRVVPPLAIGMAVVVVALSYVLEVAVPIVIPKYVGGLGLMKLTLWAGVVQAVALPLNSLIASGKSWSFGKGILAGVFAFPVVTLVLAPTTGGLLAVAGGSLAGQVVRTAIGYWELNVLSRQRAR